MMLQEKKPNIEDLTLLYMLRKEMDTLYLKKISIRVTWRDNIIELWYISSGP